MTRKFLLKPATSPLLLGRLFNTVVGLIFIVVGAINISTRSFEMYMIILNIILILLGIYYLVTGAILLAPGSRYIPRVELDPSGILIKDDIFHRSKYFDWDFLAEIQFGINQISLITQSGDKHVFRLNPREEEIIFKLKSAIKDIENDNRIMIRIS
jgi:hypothetical protein